MKTTRLIIAGLSAAALLAGASTAFAQSTVTGTLSSGGNATTSSGNNLTGTVSGGAGSGTNATGGGGSGSNTVDVCPNLSGTQSTLPSGYVVSGGNCVQNTSGTSGSVQGTSTGTANTPSSGGSVLGTGTSNPSVPNTGAGGDATSTMALLALSSIAALGGLKLMKARRA